MSREQRILLASESKIAIRSLIDISEAISLGLGTDGLIMTESELTPEFFELRSGLAGEVLQKFTNYKVRLAIVVPTPELYGKRFNELVYEHRSHGMIRFVKSVEEAKAWLSN
jgi:hypothetical protein